MLKALNHRGIGQLANTSLGKTRGAEIALEPHTIGDLIARFVATPPHLVQKLTRQPDLHPFRLDAVI